MKKILTLMEDFSFECKRKAHFSTTALYNAIAYFCSFPVLKYTLELDFVNNLNDALHIHFCTCTSTSNHTHIFALCTLSKLKSKKIEH